MSKIVGPRGSRPSYEVAGRDFFLRDLSSAALVQLTRLLWMPEDAEPMRPTQDWVLEQEQMIINLDSRLRKPRDLLTRAAIRLGKQKVPYFPQPASLCRLHSELDPRVIHNLLIMVGNECTLRVDKYRRACRYKEGTKDHVPLLPEAEAWLDRMDQISYLRLSNGHLFASIFRYHPRLPFLEKMRGCDCEACVLAVIGGTKRMLADLWAGIDVRQKAYVRYAHGRDPRLLRIITAWCGHFPLADQKHIQRMRDDLIPHIEQSRDRIIEHDRLVMEEKRRMGKHSKKHRHDHHGRSHKKHHGSRSSRSHSSSSPSSSSSHHHHPRRRHEQADKAGPAQHIRQKTYSDTERSRGSSMQTPATSLPSPFEFQVLEFMEEKGQTSSTTPVSHNDFEDYEEDEPFPVSPIEEEEEEQNCDALPRHDSQTRTVNNGQPTPLTPNYVFADEEEYESEEDELAMAEAWLKFRTANITPAHRVNIEQAAPAFSDYASMSAVPSALDTRPRGDGGETKTSSGRDSDDVQSWVSATVHTYVPRRQAPTAPPPRPPSSHYTEVPKRSRYSMAQEALREEPPAPWAQFEKRFVNEQALASLEGR